jgi:hypothetical protein
MKVEGRELSSVNTQEFLESCIATGDKIEPCCFPELSTLSSAFWYSFVPVAKAPLTPEVVFIPPARAKGREVVAALADWNFMWEAAQYRGEALSKGPFKTQFPELAAWLESLPECNIYLVADNKTKYDAYAPLYHLLPKRVLDRHGLPALKRPLWPNNGVALWKNEILPDDFAERLSRAFADHIWRYIDSGSGIRAFNSSDPLVLLSHSLDFWLPSAIRAIEYRMCTFERVEPETPKQRKFLLRARKQDFPEVSIERPRMGGVLWMGEEESAEVTQEIVSNADRNGQLRGIIDAVRSNRVVDDFSPCWSFAREDFERKLYSKRSKVGVSFVELKDTLPVHSSRSEYTDNLLWQDFSTLLDTKERHVVVCLRNGTTRLGDIATSLGYANHSPISKALARIRKKAALFLNGG